MKMTGKKEKKFRSYGDMLRIRNFISVLRCDRLREIIKCQVCVYGWTIDGCAYKLKRQKHSRRKVIRRAAKDLQSFSTFRLISPIQFSSVRQSNGWEQEESWELQKASFLAVSLFNSIIVVARKKAINFSCSTHPSAPQTKADAKERFLFCLHLVIAKSC